MKPGEKRTVHCLMDMINQVVQIDMTARSQERVQLPVGSFDLLRIDTVMHLPGGQTLPGAMWTDRGGEVLKNRTDALEMESMRATKAIAEAENAPPTFDLSRDVLVKLDRPLPGAHQTKRVRYRVELPGGDPASAFVSGPSQEVKSTGPHTAEITVYAIRPGRSDGNPRAAADPPSAASQQPNSFIQSDDPEDCRRCQGSGRHGNRPLEGGRRPGAIRASRDETGLQRRLFHGGRRGPRRTGDCKEHAAIWRPWPAPGHPGPGGHRHGLFRGAFGGHMWTEVYIDGRWIPLDATLGQGGIGTAHLKQGQSTLADFSAYVTSFPPYRPPAS